MTECKRTESDDLDPPKSAIAQRTKNEFECSNVYFTVLGELTPYEKKENKTKIPHKPAKALFDYQITKENIIQLRPTLVPQKKIHLKVSTNNVVSTHIESEAVRLIRHKYWGFDELTPQKVEELKIDLQDRHIPLTIPQIQCIRQNLLILDCMWNSHKCSHSNVTEPYGNGVSISELCRVLKVSPLCIARFLLKPAGKSGTKNILKDCYKLTRTQDEQEKANIMRKLLTPKIRPGEGNDEPKPKKQKTSRSSGITSSSEKTSSSSEKTSLPSEMSSTIGDGKMEDVKTEAPDDSIHVHRKSNDRSIFFRIADSHNFESAQDRALFEKTLRKAVGEECRNLIDCVKWKNISDCLKPCLLLRDSQGAEKVLPLLQDTLFQHKQIQSHFHHKKAFSLTPEVFAKLSNSWDEITEEICHLYCTIVSVGTSANIDGWIGGIELTQEQIDKYFNEVDSRDGTFEAKKNNFLKNLNSLREDLHKFGGARGPVQRRLNEFPGYVKFRKTVWKVFPLFDKRRAKEIRSSWHVLHIYGQDGRPSKRFKKMGRNGRNFEKRQDKNILAKGKKRKKHSNEPESHARRRFALTERDVREFCYAVEVDCVAPISQDKILEDSVLFEEDVAQFLDKYGVRYLTAEQLNTIQARIFGHSVISPDFLILDILFINGQKISWIDAKNYFGSAIHKNHNMVKSQLKQQKRYQNSIGNGAFIHKHGYSKHLEGLIKTSLLLSDEIVLDPSKVIVQSMQKTLGELKSIL